MTNLIKNFQNSFLSSEDITNQKETSGKEDNYLEKIMMLLNNTTYTGQKMKALH